MIKTRKFKLVRLAKAKHLTRGASGHYQEIGAVLQQEPGDI
jgi:hypothetical protein